MADDFASDEQLIEDAHKAVERVAYTSSVVERNACLRAVDDAITAIGKRLLQRTEERQAAEDMLTHAQELVLPISSGVLELDSFLRHRGGP